MKKISEVAKELGVSRQTVYRRVTKNATAELQSHVTKDDRGTTLIDTEGVAILTKMFDCNTDSNADNQSYSKSYSADNLLIEMMQKQISEKDEMIKDLLRKLEIMQVLLKNEQEKGQLLIEENNEPRKGFMRWFGK